jgi:hypothetical protein
MKLQMLPWTVVSNNILQEQNRKASLSEDERIRLRNMFD